MKEKNENKNHLLLQYAKDLLRRRSSEMDSPPINNEDEFSELIVEESIRSLKREEIRQDLKTIHQRMVKKRKGNQYRRWAIAASVLFICICSYVLISNLGQQKMGSEEIYASYFEPYPNLYIKKNQDNTSADSSLLGQALKAYANKQFEIAQKAFDLAEQKNLDFSDPEQFYYAISLIIVNREAEAIDLLKTLKMEDVGPLTEQVDWYLALAYIKSNRVEEAKAILNEIARQAPRQHYKKKEANAIIEQLSS